MKLITFKLKESASSVSVDPASIESVTPYEGYGGGSRIRLKSGDCYTVMEYSGTVVSKINEEKEKCQS